MLDKLVSVLLVNKPGWSSLGYQTYNLSKAYGMSRISDFSYPTTSEGMRRRVDGTFISDLVGTFNNVVTTNINAAVSLEKATRQEQHLRYIRLLKRINITFFPESIPAGMCELDVFIQVHRLDPTFVCFSFANTANNNSFNW